MKLKLPNLNPRLTRSAAVLLAALAAFLALPVPEASAQYKLPVSIANTVEDTDAGLIVRYVGAQASGTIEVSSGDLLFKHGVLASEIADATITGCGATAGTLDVDNAACNTLGELVGRCNASANWRCVRLDGLDSDTTSGATLITRAATQATPEDGIQLLWDTSVALHTTRLLAPPLFRSMRAYLGTGTALNVNPWLGKTTCVSYINATSTYGSGTSAIRLYSEVPAFGPAEPVTNTENLGYTIVSGASTVNKVITDFIYTPLCLPQNERVLVRVLNSAAMSVPVLVAGGSIVPNGF